VVPNTGAVNSSVMIIRANVGVLGMCMTVIQTGVVPITITSWTTTSIVAVVPGTATTGPVTVTVAGGVSSSAGPTFTVVSAPNIKIGRASCRAGESAVAITGTKLKALGTGSTVQLNGIAG